ncbi:MAG: SprT-like domain-containing protein [Eubacteriales bacterium]|nr:SprT-like domain-containing protein [Eubacteriales bacterium]
MNAQTIFEELRKDFIRVGIPIPDERIAKNLHFMNSVSALGRCKKENGIFMIFLSRYAMEDEKQVRTTLAHELVHTINGCMNHGKTFHRYGSMVERKLGIQVETKASKEESELSGIAEARIQKAKYVILCEGCGEKIYRQKKSNVVIHPERYRCKCGGTLKLI